MTQQRWQIWVDRGGTFTDCIGLETSTCTLRVTKVLSSDRAPLDGIRQLLQLAPDQPIPPCDVRMGTTLATNALLERKGRPTALVVTTGFADLIEIGDQTRPELFALHIEKPAQLARACLELDARMDPTGKLLTRPTDSDIERVLGKARDAGATSLAVCLLHAYRDGALEQAVARAAPAQGFEFAVTSHEVAPEIGLLARATTTLLDAYLTPLLADYVEGLLSELPGSTLRLMQSSGGLTDALRLRGPNAILSGPAGGVVAVAHIARDVGARQVIGFDMGGTSTDVCRYAGQLERVYESEIAGVRIRAPSMRIHTVAAGGGSICRAHARRLSVGPDSAGADPGPLCYGNPRARELTLTDVNLLLGRLTPDRFPLELELCRAESLLAEMAGALSPPLSPLELAEGFFQVAVSAMADAIRRVSVARGYDVRDHALVVFGGAGGQHACALARRLGIREVVFHPLAGVLSAFGIGLSDVQWHGDLDAGRVALGDDTLAALESSAKRLEESAVDALCAQGFAPEDVSLQRWLDLRYRGSESALTLPFAGASTLAERFHGAHQRAFGYARREHVIEIAVIRVEASAAGQRPELPLLPAGSAAAMPEPVRFSRIWLDGRWLESVPVLNREDLRAGDELAGPVLLLEATGTIVVEPGFSLRVTDSGTFVLRDHGTTLATHEGAPAASQETVDPVLLEIMSNAFMSIAEQMGEALRRTAFSTNIRERLDFSCAVFDGTGALVANAPHIPVHLGAMSETVRALMDEHPDLQPGDVLVSNDPARGGSHLPDITVVTPVFDSNGELTFFTASRGHHADIGGLTPGSMPALSKALSEEGVILSGLCLVREGRFDHAALRTALGSGPYPARDITANVLDLEAQVACNTRGAQLLGELVEQYGAERVRAYMGHVQDDAAHRVESEIARMPDGAHRFADALDDGTPIVVTLHVDGSRMLVDFAGTGPEHDGNLNAPRAVTVAAVIYFLRTLVGAPIPLNSGCLRPVEIRIPPGCLLDPGPDRAVAGGNVETSQRVVDVLLGAARRAAASQGTMNNFTFGNADFAYYETIAGGAGAGPDFEGASAVHTHMTNTKITDPEVLESRFPVRVRSFEVRRGSGGAGQYRGGDGVVREIELLAPLSVSILSQRRTRAPFGLAGGAAGARGKNSVDGRELGGSASLELDAGARIRIETPGGGGWGTPPED